MDIAKDILAGIGLLAIIFAMFIGCAALAPYPERRSE